MMVLPGGLSCFVNGARPQAFLRAAEPQRNAATVDGAIYGNDTYRCGLLDHAFRKATMRNASSSASSGVKE
jgi:hypothetical protein